MDRVVLCVFYFSSAISKHWEAELATLKGNNAKLTAALLESTANVKQWKQQLAAYQEEAERLHKRASTGCCPWNLWPADFLGQRKFTCRFSAGTSFGDFHWFSEHIWVVLLSVLSKNSKCSLKVMLCLGSQSIY